MVKERDSTDLIHEDVQESQNRKPWRRYLEAELGLRDHWYPAIFSHELKEGETKAETIAGERLYFKRVDGNVYCMETGALTEVFNSPGTLRSTQEHHHLLVPWLLL